MQMTEKCHLETRNKIILGVIYRTKGIGEINSWEPNNTII